MSKMDILLMRHGYDDHSYIDGLNDTSLTVDGIEIAKKASRIYAPKLGKRFEAGMSLRVSSRRRAVETAEILSEELDCHGIENDLVVNSDFRELYQGDMIGLDGKNHAERVRMLELGWEIFERERLAGNDDYKYGTPDYSNLRYDSFNRLISPPYGESQNELSDRVESGFVDTLYDVLPTGRTPLFIVHRGTIREILNITMAHNVGNYDIKQNPHIEMAGWKYCEMFETNLDDVNFSLGALARKVYGKKRL